MTIRHRSIGFVGSAALCKNAVLSQARCPSPGDIFTRGGSGEARPPADAPVISLSSRGSFLRVHGSSVGVDNAVQYFYSFPRRKYDVKNIHEEKITNNAALRRDYRHQEMNVSLDKSGGIFHLLHRSCHSPIIRNNDNI